MLDAMSLRRLLNEVRTGSILIDGVVFTEDAAETGWLDEAHYAALSEGSVSPQV